MNKNKFTICELKSDGFDWMKIPNSKGVYFVKIKNTKKPIFLPPNKGTGGWFNNKNPNVSLEKLDKNWIDLSGDREKIIYIGQDGGGKSESTLRKRIKQYISFGKGRSVGHWGGRLIWQIINSDDLEIEWKKNNNPLYEERARLVKFKKNTLSFHSQI